MQTANTICGALLLIVNFLGVAAIGYCLMLRLLRVKKGDGFAVILTKCMRRICGCSGRIRAARAP